MYRLTEDDLGRLVTACQTHKEHLGSEFMKDEYDHLQKRLKTYIDQNYWGDNVTNDTLEKRRYLIALFTKNDFTISSGLYEFCDHYINEGLTGTNEEIIKEYKKFKDLHL